MTQSQYIKSHFRRRRPTPETDQYPLLPSLLIGLGSVGVAILVILALVATLMLLTFGPAQPLVTIPNVLGMPENEAATRLQAAGLTLKVANYAFNSDVKEGNIISISPYEGKLVRAGRDVRATVSRGSRNVKMPDLKGQPLTEATAKLTELDLQVGETERKADKAEAETVIAQSVPPGTVLGRKKKIDLTLSGGRDFGTYDGPDGRTYVFQTLKLTVPQGKPLQMVSVTVSDRDGERSFLDRLCRPGEAVDVDVYGPSGARVRVRIEDERVYSERL